MAAAGLDGAALLRAAVLGAAALAVRPPVMAQTPEVVISASREADAALTAKVEKVLDEDPYLYVGHIQVVTEHGVVRLEGVATDVSDMFRALMLARRAARGRRVLNEIELITDVECHD